MRTTLLCPGCGRRCGYASPPRSPSQVVSLEVRRARMDDGQLHVDGYLTDQWGELVDFTQDLDASRLPHSWLCHECGREVTLTLAMARRGGRAKRLLLT